MRFHTSYSSRRLDTNCCRHRYSGGKRSSASRCAKRPSYRGRSSVLSVLLQVLHEIARGREGFARRWGTASEHGWRKPALANRLGKQRIYKEWAATRLRRYDFRHHTVTVGDQHLVAITPPVPLCEDRQ